MGLLKFIKNAERRWNDFLLENYDIVEKAEPKPIKIYINSEGGEIFAAIPLIDAITNSKIPIHTYIEGIAASAASLISMAGHRRFITKNSFMLIHQLSATVLGGKYEEFRDELKNQEKIMHTVKNIYLEKGKLNEDQLTDLMKHDLWLDAETVLKYGFADEII